MLYTSHNTVVMLSNETLMNLRVQIKTQIKKNTKMKLNKRIISIVLGLFYFPCTEGCGDNIKLN